jgi:hypothetical protein
MNRSQLQTLKPWILKAKAVLELVELDQFAVTQNNTEMLSV